MFDYDGVIADSQEILFDNFKKACRTHRYQVFDSMESFLNMFDKNIYESMMDRGVPAEGITRICKSLDDNLALCKTPMKLFANTPEMLSELARDNVVIIITSSISRAVEQNLQENNIEGVKDVLGAEKETNKVKKITRTIQDYPDASYYYVGDTMGDIIEGRKGGAKTIGVSWGWHGREKLRQANPDYLVDTPAELLAIFEKI
jgi:phosphoglycolate phosphatase